MAWIRQASSDAWPAGTSSATSDSSWVVSAGSANTPRGSVQSAATRSGELRTAIAATGPRTSSSDSAQERSSAFGREQLPEVPAQVLTAVDLLGETAATRATGPATEASSALPSVPSSSSHR